MLRANHIIPGLTQDSFARHLNKWGRALTPGPILIAHQTDYFD